MCGIAGWLTSSPGQADDAATLQKMADSIRHRGPDGEGYEILPGLAFAHRRLAILDIEGGRQPMYSHDDRYLISYNGEIYNYLELKEELLGQGHRFASESDTEVILEMFRREGVAGFRRLRGMFAFALHDIESGKSWLVRDHFGIKPLFYHVTSGEVCFASEAKAILERLPECRSLNHTAVHWVMSFRYIIDDSTLFAGIDQLPAGHCLEWDGSGHKIYSYGEPVAGGASSSIIETLDDSVRHHMIADVEVGCYLSGGIDSGSITALAKKHTDLRTFSLDIGDDPRELENARDTARILGVDNISGQIDIDAASDLKKCIWHLEVPKVNALQVYSLSRYASGHVKVVLSGVGGDELFVGYNMHKYFMWREPVKNHLNWLQSLGDSLVASMARAVRPEPWSELERIGEILRHNGDGSQVYGLLRNAWNEEALGGQVYGEAMLDAGLPSPFSWLARSWPRGENDLQNFLDFEWQHKMVNDLLWQEDRCSMAHGLESRVPFVDLEMKKVAGRYSVRELLEGTGGRRRLKGRFRDELRSILPAEILDRRKSGFQVDSPEFFHTQLGGLAEQYLSPEIIRKHGLFNEEFVSRVLACPPRTRLRWHYFMLYLMIGFHMWAELYLQEPASVG